MCDYPILKKKNELRENLLRLECIKELRLYLQTDILNQIIGTIMTSVKIFKKEKKKKDAVAF